MKRWHTFSALLFLSFFPSTAMAHGLTDSGVFKIPHFWLGSPLIGYIEGLILARIYKLKKRGTVGWLILANFITSLIWILGLEVQPITLTFQNAVLIILTMLICIYLTMNIVMYPFVVLSLRKDPEWAKKSATVTFVIQTASFLLILGWYNLFGPATLITKTSTVDISKMALPNDILVYFISSKDGDVYSKKLSGYEETSIYPLKSSTRTANFGFEKNEKDGSKWDLVAFSTRDPDKSFPVIKSGFNSNDIPSLVQGSSYPQYSPRGWSYFKFPSLGSVNDVQWKGERIDDNGYDHGVNFINKQSGEKISIGFRTIIGELEIKFVTLIPTDKAIFQIGDDQIVIMDLATRRIAPFVKGRNPIPVFIRPDSN